MKHGLAYVNVLQPSPWNDRTRAEFESLECECGFEVEAESSREAWPVFWAHLQEASDRADRSRAAIEELLRDDPWTDYGP